MSNVFGQVQAYKVYIPIQGFSSSVGPNIRVLPKAVGASEKCGRGLAGSAKPGFNGSDSLELRWLLRLHSAGTWFGQIDKWCLRDD